MTVCFIHWQSVDEENCSHTPKDPLLSSISTEMLSDMAALAGGAAEPSGLKQAAGEETEHPHSPLPRAQLSIRQASLPDSSTASCGPGPLGLQRPSSDPGLPGK